MPYLFDSIQEMMLGMLCCIAGSTTVIVPLILITRPFLRKLHPSKLFSKIEKRMEANRNNGSKGGRPKKTEVITEEPNALTQKPIAFSVKSENPNEAKRSEANINEENTPHTPQGGRGAASEEYSDDFELFWHEYPNHNSGKKKAYTAFKRALKKVSFAEMLKSLDAHKKSSQWTKDGGAYIPHATTWLNGERWTVEMGVLDDGREVDEDGIVWTGRKYLCKN